MNRMNTEHFVNFIASIHNRLRALIHTSLDEKISILLKLEEFVELIRNDLENNLADYIMPDTIWTGGISEIKKIATMAEAYYIPITPHVIPGGPIELISAAHVVSSVPNFYRLEHSHVFIPEHNNYLEEPYLIKEGHIHLNDKPGLGFELDETKLDKLI